MAKNLKLNIQNTQIAAAVNLGNLKKKVEERQPSDAAVPSAATDKPKPAVEPKKPAAKPKRRARAHSQFEEENSLPEVKEEEKKPIEVKETREEPQEEKEKPKPPKEEIIQASLKKNSPESVSKRLFKEPSLPEESTVTLEEPIPTASPPPPIISPLPKVPPKAEAPPLSRPPFSQQRESRPPMRDAREPREFRPAMRDSREPRPPMGDSRPPMGDSRPPLRDSRPPMRDSRPPMRDSRPPMGDSRPPMRDSRPPMRDSRPPMGDSRPPMRDSRPPMRDSRPPMGDSRPPMRDSRPPMRDSREPREFRPSTREGRPTEMRDSPPRRPAFPLASKERLGPTGRHIRDLLPPKDDKHRFDARREGKNQVGEPLRSAPTKSAASSALPASSKAAKTKEFRDIKPAKKVEQDRFDSRDRQGLRTSEEEQRWRRKRAPKLKKAEQKIVRPSSLKIRLPTTVKELAADLKIKASEVIQKLFLQGMALTINGILDDATTVQLIGNEFDCAISIDTSKEEKIRVTDQSVMEEIRSTPAEKLTNRPPVVAFMGHVDHGKTSLIDYIRSTRVAEGEAGSITQHIGAFECKTAVGLLTILDTPGHEAFQAMRARGALVTDIVVLVIAGDEGIKEQTVEAINCAKEHGATIIVALNKCDKPGFDPEMVYRQLADHDLLPEVWGGGLLTVNCSATTGEGVERLLEAVALQAEVLELKANPLERARGVVLESKMHKGLGAIATLIVQNGSLHWGDPIVFAHHFGRIKTMQDHNGRDIKIAPPSSAIAVTGLSGLPSAGEEFIVVESEKAAREISQARTLDYRQTRLTQTRAISAETMMQKAAQLEKKVLHLIIRGDVQGSCEALRTALEKIRSDKVDLNIVLCSVGEISESDVQLAATSGAAILGFNTQVESHAESLVKQLNVKVKLHDIIYHAVDATKELMRQQLDTIAIEEHRGTFELKALFRSSHLGLIAGGMVIEGSLARNHRLRLKRQDKTIWEGTMSSLRREKDDVREVTKGLECGIVLSGWRDIEVGDIIESFEIKQISQEL